MRLLEIIGPPPAGLAAMLAPSGVLRAGINLSNFLLVTGKTSDGAPAGVAPDMAKAFADALGVGVRYVPYASPGPIADAAPRDEWDIALIGAEPQRAEVIGFTPAYTEIEATYLVPQGSTLENVAEVDRPGKRIAVTDRTAYGLWLERNVVHAELVRAKTFDDALLALREQKLDALAGLRAGLLADQKALPGSRLLPGRYMTVQQAFGTPRRKDAALDYMARFVRAAIVSGYVAGLIARHGVEGLTVAEPTEPGDVAAASV
jgi:polar amino acid transport system substrate-binding protein